MQFFLITLLAAAALVVAQTPGFDAISAPTQDESINAGSSFEIIWEPAAQDGTITITLLQGASPSTLQLGPVVAASIDNQVGKFVWKPVPEAQFATYGFKISLDSDPATFQYSFPFHIEGKIASSSYGVSTSTKETGAADYPTSSVASYPTTKSFVSYTTTVSMAPVPSYSAYLTTDTATLPTNKPTNAASLNSTWVKPSGSGYLTTMVPIISAAPSGALPSPAQLGAATRLGTVGYTAIAGLVLALAM